MIYEARTAAVPTQRALAARIGTKPSVIARLEDADVDSDALFLLHRITAALGHALDIRLVPVPEQRQSRVSRALPWPLCDVEIAGSQGRGTPPEIVQE